VLTVLQVSTLWVAFVDDDDTIAPEYVEYFHCFRRGLATHLPIRWLIEEHMLDRSLDVIIFRWSCCFPLALADCAV
jgi:hypothetical protein